MPKDNTISKLEIDKELQALLKNKSRITSFTKVVSLKDGSSTAWVTLRFKLSELKEGKV